MLSKDNRRSACDSWMILRNSSQSRTNSELATISAGVEYAGMKIRYAVGNHGEAKLLLPVVKGVSNHDIGDSAELQIETTTMVNEGVVANYVEMTCLAIELESVFSELVDVILDKVAAGQECTIAARTTIEQYRALLHKPESLTAASDIVTGLIGELYVLNRLLDLSPKAWRLWLGPAGSRHDFKSGVHSIEVKTTSNLKSQLCTVNSIEQLLASSGGKLSLLRLTIEKVVEGELSISSLGRSALAKADDPSSLSTLIAEAGCHDVDSQVWNTATYRLASIQLYDVQPGFPRIIPSMLVNESLEAGVVSVSYSIDLSYASPFLQDLIRLSEIEREMVTCMTKS